MKKESNICLTLAVLLTFATTTAGNVTASPVIDTSNTLVIIKHPSPSTSAIPSPGGSLSAYSVTSTMNSLAVNHQSGSTFAFPSAGGSFTAYSVTLTLNRLAVNGAVNQSDSTSAVSSAGGSFTAYSVHVTPTLNSLAVNQSRSTSAVPTADYGSFLNNSLTSPGYPNNYPSHMDGYYEIPIPHGMMMKIYFQDFRLEDHFLCLNDYLMIKNGNNEPFGIYCGGSWIGEEIIVTGDYVVITFHTDHSVEERGFLLIFTAVPVAINESHPNVLYAIPGYELSCSVYAGTLPVYAALMRGSTVMVNKTNYAWIPLYEEGNYTCVATNKYGTAVREYSVIFVGCGSIINNTLMSPGYPRNYLKNMECSYSVPITQGALKIYFDDFNLPGPPCDYPELRITSDHYNLIGVYCGKKTGESVVVTGSQVSIDFSSGNYYQGRRFLIRFSDVGPGCGLVRNNTLTSPGYPNSYPKNMDCNYYVAIPRGMAVKVYFHDFVLENASLSNIYDYLKITNENNRVFGYYHGNRKGDEVFVIGDYALISFHSDGGVEDRGYLIHFSNVSLALFPDCLLPNKIEVRHIGVPWLSNSTTKCVCNSNVRSECVTLDNPACTDNNGIVRYNHDKWLIGSCVKCSCVNAAINCYKYDVNISYGLIKVNKVATCEQCDHVPETATSCAAFFRIPGDKLFQCSIRGSFILKIHRCNGVKECPDGSDEIKCENVICKQEDGRTLIINGSNGWEASSCVRCHCIEGNISCQKTLSVFLPGDPSGAYGFVETCRQPSCNVLHFLGNKRHTCEAIEVLENGGILMKGQTYNNSGCEFYFPGYISPNIDSSCPEMARKACYVFNGGVCCTSECSALRDLGTQMRGHLAYCPSGRQLAAVTTDCGKSVIQCSRGNVNQSCSSVVTCEDENSNKYFEGAGWTVGRCIQCLCRGGQIHCERNISVVTSKETLSQEFCHQPVCNVVNFVKMREEACFACRWKGQIYYDGDHWKENGVDFYCSSSERKVRAGCYVEENRVNCTGAIPGIRDLSKISHESLFLCASGDEIRSMDDRCNIRPDCDDQSDERNCRHYYCSTSEGKFGEKRSRVNQEIITNCSIVDSSWEGTFHRKCEIGLGKTKWSDKRNCRCEKKSTARYFRSRLAEVNESNLINISMELSSSAGNFINKRIFHEMFTDLFNVATTLFTPITPLNFQLALIYTQHVIRTAIWSNIYFSIKAEQKGFCSETTCYEELVDERYSLAWKAVDFLRRRGYTDQDIGKTYFSIRRDCPQLRNFVTIEYTQSTITSPQLRLGLSLNTAALVPSVKNQESSRDLNITTTLNGTGHHNITDEQLKAILDAKGCKGVSLDKSGNLVIKNSAATKSVLKHQAIQNKMENWLLCASVGAIILYFVVLLLIRIKKTERIFVHANLLLSLGLGNLVYVLDKTVFTNRMDRPVLCSIVAVTQHYLHTALFTWMLVEGINLYTKLVKVFSAKKQYLAFTAVGWGIPAVIVGVVASIRPSSYDMGLPLTENVMCGSLKFTSELKRTRCWLNGSLWIFKGPILFLLLVNVGLFVILLRVIFGKLSQKFSQDNIKFARRGLRSILALLPLLGVTWLLGFFIEFHTALAYVFILLNSTQGILFTIFHCCFDDQVREGLKKLGAKHHVVLNAKKSSSSTSVIMETMNMDRLQHPESHPGSATVDVSLQRDHGPYDATL